MEAIADIVQQVPVALERLVLWLNEMAVRYPQLDQSAAVLAQLEEKLAGDRRERPVHAQARSGQRGVPPPSVWRAASSAALPPPFIAFVFSFYLLMQKEKSPGRSSGCSPPICTPRAAERTVQVCCLLDKNFSSFIAGQCLEAVILGSMFVVSMTLLRMPYAVMVGVLIAFTALISIVGAFIGCFVGAFLILLEDPMQAVAFIGAVPGAAAAGRQLYLPRVVGQLGGSALHLGAGRCYGGRQPVWHRGYAGVHSADLHGLFPAAGQRQCPNAARAAQNVPSPPQAVSDKRKKERTPGLLIVPEDERRISPWKNQYWWSWLLVWAAVTAA